MKLSYHKYFIEHKANRYQQNLLPFLKRFSEIDSKTFKRSFSKHGEQLFLFELTHQLFLFVVTKDTEIIKSINSDDFSHQDIHEKLGTNENIGFASYIYFSDRYYGIASTIHGPKNIIFNNFINDVFEKIGLGGYTFQSAPFPVESDRNSVKKLAFKGAVRFDISKPNPLYEEIRTFFGKPKDTDKISISFKPLPRKEMEDTFDRIVDKLDDYGLENFIVKGKETLQDSLTDFYITGTGHIADSITSKGEKNICNSIKSKVAKNSMLQNSIEEYKNDKDYSQIDIQNISNFNDIRAWDSYLQTITFL